MAYRLAPLWNADGSPRDPLDVVVTRRCEHRDCEAFVEPLFDPWTRRCVEHADDNRRVTPRPIEAGRRPAWDAVKAAGLTYSRTVVEAALKHRRAAS